MRWRFAVRQVQGGASFVLGLQDADEARKQAAKDDAGTASDDRIRFDHKTAEARAELQRVEIQVRECMHENAQLWCAKVCVVDQQWWRFR
jgi:hypothetical protein